MLQSIYDRRSIRKFKSDPISQELVVEVLRSGMASPSSKNRQPWKYIVVSGPAKEKMLAVMQQGLVRESTEKTVLPNSNQYIGGAEHSLQIMQQAPVVVFILNTLAKDLFLPLTTEERVSEICNVQSIGASIENMSLAATELGLGSLWICDIFFAYQELNQWLGNDGELVAALALGYADEQPPARPRKAFVDVVEWRNEI